MTPINTSTSKPVRYLGLMLVLSSLSGLTSSCSSNSHTDVTLPNGIHCQSESSGFFLWRSTSTSCVDDKGKVIGSYSNY
jgi:hypothetical protein